MPFTFNVFICVWQHLLLFFLLLIELMFITIVKTYFSIVQVSNILRVLLPCEDDSRDKERKYGRWEYRVRRE